MSVRSITGATKTFFEAGFKDGQVGSMGIPQCELSDQSVCALKQRPARMSSCDGGARQESVQHVVPTRASIAPAIF